MATTYAELLTEVEDWAKRPDLTSVIPTFVLDAESLLNRDKRLREMREMESSTDITINAATASVPSDFLEVRRLYLDTDPKTSLSYLEPHVFYASHAGSGTGKPTSYTIEGDNFVFGNAPDSTYTGKLTYVAKLPSLVTNSTNWLLDSYPDIYRYATLVSLAHYTRDREYMADTAGMYSEAMKSLKKDGRYGGSIKYVPKVSP